MQRGSANEPVLNQTEARQGNAGRPVMVVLVTALVLAALALGGVWLGMFGS